jgi:hypothetical protein
MRLRVYNRWKANWFKVWPEKPKTDVEAKDTKFYTVKPGDYGSKISSKFKISFDKLFQANKSRKVRNRKIGSEGYYWKTARKLYPWDKLIIPN